MKQLALYLLVGVSVFSLFGCSPSEPKKNYRILQAPMSTSGPEVIEFFAYFCPHCNHLEKALEPWREKLPKSVKFTRIPLTLGNKGTRIYSKAYYIAETLGILSTTHKALFERYHQQHLSFQNDAQLKEFYLSLGVSAMDYDKVLRDPSLQRKIDSAEALAKTLKIASVPSFVINGKFVTDAGMSGGEKPLFALINVLLRKK